MVAFLCALSFLTSSLPAEVTEIKAPSQLSVVRVSVTTQAWDFGKPWTKKPPVSRKAIGAVLPGGRVLVTGELVANASYVEIETADGNRKAPAVVDVVDYEANLALLRTDDPTILQGLRPLELAAAVVGDMINVWQVEANGNLLVTSGPLTTAEVGRYPLDESPLLQFRLTVPLQFREGAFTLPVVKGDRLVGLVMRYDAQSNNADIVPAPVIEHFLRDAAQMPYEGFPRAGIAFSGTRDPQFRRFLGAADGIQGGVYVTEVIRGGPAAQAGLQRGDVLLRADNTPIDSDGNYADATYGRISLTHLLTTLREEGDTITFTVLRAGKTLDLPVILKRRPVEQYTVEPYVIDRAPKFYLLGGLVLQELSRQYLKEWGPDWVKKAPDELVYLDRQQNELYPEANRKIVFLSRILPSNATIGYEGLSFLIVSRINGQDIRALSDIPAALAAAIDGVHKVEFTTEPRMLFLDAEQVAQSEAILAKTYRLPSLKRL